MSWGVDFGEFGMEKSRPMATMAAQGTTDGKRRTSASQASGLWSLVRQSPLAGRQRYVGASATLRWKP